MSLRDWLDERTGYRKLLDEALDEPIPGGARLAYVWGSALTLSFIVQAVTGMLLMTAYQPSATTAWSSVMYISHQMTWGWVVRGLHHYGAQAMVILMAIHLGQTAIYGAYKKPREMNWLLGLGLMGLTLGFALTGYLLPWDQKGYWATKVATNIAATLPLVGTQIQRLLVGGTEYGHLTLTRFYALHVFLLPALLVLLLAGHIALFRRHGVTPPEEADHSKVDRFYPKQLGLDLLVGLVVLGILFGLTWMSHGVHLDAPADPASDYPARPEWYFLPLFEVLKYVPGQMEWLVAAGIPLVLGGYLVALPFIDKKEGLRKRAAVLAPMLVLLLGAAVLTYLSRSADANNPDFQKAQQAAAKQAARAIELAKKGVPPAGPLAMLANDPATRGPQLFDKHCTACHSLGKHGPKDGKLTAPDLTGFGTAKWVLAVLDNPDDPKLFGNTAFKESMPSFTREPKDPDAKANFTAMKKVDQAAIATFLVAEARGDGKPGSRGEKLVKQRCTSCHRLDGETDDDGSLAPELRGWASLKWIKQQIANPATGITYPRGAADEELKGHMPAFEDQLSARDIDVLTKWVYQQAAKD